MPIYEYECQQCKQVTESMQKFSDAPLVECPQCRGTLRKMISQSSFHLKGSGWYVTDYARKGECIPTGKKEKPAESKDTSPGKTSDPSPASPASGTSEAK